MRFWKVYGLGIPFVVEARSREHAELVVDRLYRIADVTSLWIIEHDLASAC